MSTLTSEQRRKLIDLWVRDQDGIPARSIPPFGREGRTYRALADKGLVDIRPSPESPPIPYITEEGRKRASTLTLIDHRNGRCWP